jgi:hypothetical protein
MEELEQGARDHRFDTMKNLGVKKIHVFLINSPTKLHTYI